MSKEPRGDTAWNDELQNWPEDQREWAQLAAASMTFFDAPDDAVGQVLAEVRQSVVASGQTPTEVFGEPVAFGRTRGKRLRDPADVLESALPFRDVTGAIQTVLLTLGFLVLALGLVLGFDDGWSARPFSFSVIVLFPVISVLMGAGMWGWILRTRGRLLAPLIIWTGVLIGLVVTVALVSSLEFLNVPGPPNWIMTLIGGGVVILAFFIPQARARALVDDARWDDERWFTHAEKLLRGRYLFSRTQAVEALRGPRHHRRLTGPRGTAGQEFGNVELFVAQLAPGARAPIKRGIVLRRVGYCLIVLCFAVTLVAEFIEDPITWWLIVRAAMMLCLVVGIFVSWLPKRMRKDIEEANAAREADARFLSPGDASD